MRKSAILATAAVLALAGCGESKGDLDAVAAYPPDESAFGNIVDSVETFSSDDVNQIQKKIKVDERNARICKLFKRNFEPYHGVTISNWHGKIDNISTTSGGAGVLSIVISRNIKLSTKSFVSLPEDPDTIDKQNDTILANDSEIFKTLSGMQAGQSVVFSGRFYPADDKNICAYSMNPDAYVTLKDPEFLFQFTELKPAD
jgi:hypothetical protein